MSTRTCSRYIRLWMITIGRIEVTIAVSLAGQNLDEIQTVTGLRQIKPGWYMPCEQLLCYIACCWLQYSLVLFK